jgi:hypothetical protein
MAGFNKPDYRRGTTLPHSLDPGFFDDRPPFLGFGFYKRPEYARCPSSAQENLTPVIDDLWISNPGLRPLHLDVGRSDHLAQLFGFVGEELAEVGR